jgi:hypothetical protein
MLTLKIELTTNEKMLLLEMPNGDLHCCTADACDCPAATYGNLCRHRLFIFAMGGFESGKTQPTCIRHERNRNAMNVNQAFPSKYLKADGDLPEEGNLILTMDRVELEDVGSADKTEIKPVLYFRDHEKGLVVNKTNGSTIAGLYGPETDDWGGKKIALFSQEVDFQGRQVLAIRVRMKKPQTAAPAPAPAPKVEEDEDDPFRGE